MAGAPDAARSITSLASTAKSAGFIALIEALKDEEDLDMARALIEGRGEEFPSRDLDENEPENALVCSMAGIDMLKSSFVRHAGTGWFGPPLPMLSMVAAMEDSEPRIEGGRLFAPTGTSPGTSIMRSSSVKCCMRRAVISSTRRRDKPQPPGPALDKLNVKRGGFLSSAFRVMTTSKDDLDTAESKPPS